VRARVCTFVHAHACNECVCTHANACLYVCARTCACVCVRTCAHACAEGKRDVVAIDNDTNMEKEVVKQGSSMWMRGALMDM